MFWGLIMEPKRRYTQVVKKAFHISKAALDISNADDEPTQVMCSFDNRNYLLCTLNKDSELQCSLELNFDVGDEVSFATNGNSHVHLTGYIHDDFSGEDDEEVEEEEEEVKDKQDAIKEKSASRKRKKENDLGALAAKKPYMDLFNSLTEDDSDDDTFEEEEDDEDGEGEGEASDESDDGDIFEESEDEEVEDESDYEATPKAKVNGTVQSKKNKKQAQQQVQQSPELTKQQKKKQKKQQQQEAKEGKKDKKAEFSQKAAKESGEPSAKKKKQAEESPKESNKKRTIEGGVVIEDIRVGNGVVAKPGRMVQVFYEGRLKSNNKMFDSSTKGNGFKFRLGKQEVIKGWDVGLSGMKVGGKRRIICPPNMAYGQKGSPPTIPPNSTLVFEVELKNVV